MTSEPIEADPPATQAATDAATASPGAILRQAREAQGLHLGALATLLKVTPRKLEALEADRHDELQGATFVRALAQAACRALKIDPGPVLARLPRQEVQSLVQVSNGLNAPFRERGGKREPSEPLLASRGFLVLIGLLVLAALALWLVPRESLKLPWLARPSVSSMAPAASGVADGQAEPVAAPAPQASEPLRGDVGSPVAPVLAEVAASAPLVPSVTAPPPVLPSVGASSAATTALAPAASAGLDAAVPLQVQARLDSWVEVVDASGKTLLARTVAAGESVGLNGAFPMRVKVGNVSGTELLLRGKPVDMQSATRDNVARLELK